MPESRITECPLPLFDRLGASGAAGQTASRSTDRRLLFQSILDELSRLLNSRSPVLPEYAEWANGTVLDYGIPDLSSVTPAREGDRQKVAEIIERRVAAYEPRLCDVRASVMPSPGDSQGLHIVISGSVRVGSTREPISLPIALDRGSARLRLEAASAD